MDTYIVFRVRKGFIVYNKAKAFKEGHTHVYDFGTAKMLINLSRHRTIPQHLSLRQWHSLLRISTGKVYCKKLRNIIDQKELS